MISSPRAKHYVRYSYVEEEAEALEVWGYGNLPNGENTLKLSSWSNAITVTVQRTLDVYFTTQLEIAISSAPLSASTIVSLSLVPCEL